MFLSSRHWKSRVLGSGGRLGGRRATAKQEIVAGALIINSTGINPRDIFAVIHMPGRKESDVSFKSAEKLDLFWTPYEEEKDQSHWEKLS